ncbi:Homeodomain-like protein with RING/FYVE/PHD-type zinc finger domain [Euphorbia peplus]|nr:Homeodomain-like protein with RING/FYVE/PHD-type zinc finger domain [Euphorbia peplus]
MRTKTTARRPFHRSYLRPPEFPTTAARPLPPPFTDNISNGNDSADTIESHSCSESGDNVSHTSVFSGDEEMDDEITCLECDEGGELLLICCGVDCPVVVHKKCMSGEANYDDRGKFYCPFCWYKVMKGRMIELRKKAMLARKDLNCFLKFNSETACRDREKGNGVNVGKVVGESSPCERVNSVDVDGEVHNEGRDVEEDHQGNGNGKLLCTDKQNDAREKGKNIGEVVGESNRCELDNSVDVGGEVRNEARKVEEERQQDGNEKRLCCDQSGEVDECVKISGTGAREIQADEVGDDEKDEGTNADEENSVFNEAFLGSPGATSNTSEPDRVSMEKEEEMTKDGSTTVNVSCTSVDGALNIAEVSDSETEDCVLGLKRRRRQNTDSPKKSAFHSHTGSTQATRKLLVEVERVATLNAQFVAGNTLVDGALQGSPGTKPGTSSLSERDRLSMEIEGQMNKGAPTANVPCTSVDGALNEPEVRNSDTENLEMLLRHVKEIKSANTGSPKGSEFHPHTTSTKATSKPIEEFVYSENPKQPEIPAKKPVELPFAHEKRKRINWTPEEVEALREAVQKISTTSNIPWRKILDSGRHIFHPSRNSTDLKDKWKKLRSRSHND